MIQNGVCCFTGHRNFEQSATPRQKLILQKLIQNMIAGGYTTFVTGGAIGFDTVAAELVLQKREEGQAVRLELVLPCADQDARWSPAQKQRYRKILKAADSVECLHDRYTDGCMHERNRRMVDKSSLCVAFCEKTSGGTYFTVTYARDHGVTVYNIPDMDRMLK